MSIRISQRLADTGGSCRCACCFPLPAGVRVGEVRGHAQPVAQLVVGELGAVVVRDADARAGPAAARTCPAAPRRSPAVLSERRGPWRNPVLSPPRRLHPTPMTLSAPNGRTRSCRHLRGQVRRWALGRGSGSDVLLPPPAAAPPVPLSGRHRAQRSEAACWSRPIGRWSPGTRA